MFLIIVESENPLVRLRFNKSLNHMVLGYEYLWYKSIGGVPRLDHIICTRKGRKSEKKETAHHMKLYLYRITLGTAGQNNGLHLSRDPTKFDPTAF